MKIKKKLSLTSYCYLLPCMLVFAVFLFYPFVKTVYLSLFKTNKYGQAKLFVGLENYTDLLTSASFQNSLKVTMIYVVIVVLGSMFLGLVQQFYVIRHFLVFAYFQLPMLFQWQLPPVRQL